MKVTHFQIARWGTASIYWNGTEKEIAFFKNWIKKTIPKQYYGFYKHPTEEYSKTNFGAHFHVSAWVFLCYYWTDVHAPALNQIWKYKRNPFHPNLIYPDFEGKSCQSNKDRASLQFRITELQFYQSKNSDKKIQKAIDFLQSLVKSIPWVKE